MKLRLKVPNDKQFEGELMKELKVKDHEELEEELKRISDPDMVRIFTELVKRKKRQGTRWLEERRATEVTPYA